MSEEKIYGNFSTPMAEKGYAVIPLKGKVPNLPKWQKTLPETISINPKYDNYNIGMLTGEPSGVLVIDVDTKDPAFAQAIYSVLPDTPVMKKGAKGINFFYKFNGEENTNFKNPNIKTESELEILGTGRQTVLPPSIHPDTNEAYYWCDKEGNPSENSILTVPKEELPDLPKEIIPLLEKMIIEKSNPSGNVGGVAGLLEAGDTGNSHKDLGDYKEIPAGYEDRCRSGSHDRITAAIMAMINQGKNKKTVVDEAMAFDREYNTFYKNPYFECKSCPYQGTPRQKAEYLYKSCFETVKKKKEEAGEEMPEISEVEENKGLKENPAVYKLLKNFGVKYDLAMTKWEGQPNVMKQGKKDLFRYDGRKWIHCQEDFDDKIYIMLNNYMGLNKSHNQVNSAKTKFVKFIPSVEAQGRDFFEHNPYIANFKNGTLHVMKGNKLEFKEHNRNDFCTDIINLDYGTEEKNLMFEEMLQRIFEGDPDKDDKILALQEMFGLAILPRASRVFFMYGVSGSGKSTIGKILTYLIGGENISSVDPSSFDGFNMETMINKKVNMDLDISVSKPISDGNFKKIEDGHKVRIRRKGVQDIEANIPWLHIFGANSLPKNFDGRSGAYERRVTIIHFGRSFTNNGQAYDRDFAKKVFNHNPEGVLNFAMEGIKRLIATNFKFTVPSSGLEAVKAWETETDIVAKFIQDLEEEEVSGVEYDPIIDPNGKIPRTELWTIFEKWKREVGKGHNRLGRAEFYTDLRRKCWPERKINGTRYFKGIGLKQPEIITPSQESGSNHNSADYSGY